MGDPADGEFMATSHHPAAPTRAVRKNLFLSATIEAGAMKAPVRIRNMSETGAMIDGAALPDVGSVLTLHRLAVDIGATVIWHADGRCGIEFDGLVSVDEWVAGKRQAHRFGGEGQSRVDAIQAAIRSGALLPEEDSPTAQSALRSEGLDRRIADELLYVRRLLDTVGDDLTKDPILLQRYSRTLQSFDAACQILGHLSMVVGAEDRAEAAAAVTMQELRGRLLAKSIL